MKILFIYIILLFTNYYSFGQCVVDTGSDFSITATFSPVRMVPQGGCTSGPGNFVAEVAYDIKVEGSNIPTPPVFFYQVLLTCGDVSLNASGNLPVTQDQVSGTYTTAQNFFRNGDCATSTPASLDCIGKENITFRGITRNFRFFNIQCESFEAKPAIKFENLDATVTNAQYLINWAVDKAEQVEYFIVEKSFDERNFKAISDKIESRNEPRFKFQDESSDLFSNTNFYRIRLVSNDGLTSYSPVFTPGLF